MSTPADVSWCRGFWGIQFVTFPLKSLQYTPCNINMHLFCFILFWCSRPSCIKMIYLLLSLSVASMVLTTGEPLMDMGKSTNTKHNKAHRMHGVYWFILCGINKHDKRHTIYTLRFLLDSGSWLIPIWRIGFRPICVCFVFAFYHLESMG